MPAIEFELDDYILLLKALREYRPETCLEEANKYALIELIEKAARAAEQATQ